MARDEAGFLAGICVQPEPRRCRPSTPPFHHEPRAARRRTVTKLTEYQEILRALRGLGGSRTKRFAARCVDATGFRRLPGSSERPMPLRSERLFDGAKQQH